MAKPKSRRIIRSPLCVRIAHCGAKAILGTPVPWPEGGGFQQPIWCCRCNQTGVRSENTGDRTGTATAMVVAPPLPKAKSR